MLGAVEDQVLVDLVRDDEQVPLDRELGDGGQLGPGQDGAGGVVRGVEQDQPRPVGDGGPQLVQVEDVGALVGRSVTGTRVPPAIATQAAYES